MQGQNDSSISLKQPLSSGSVGNRAVDFYLEKQVNKVTAKFYETTVSKVKEQPFTQKIYQKIALQR